MRFATLTTSIFFAMVGLVSARDDRLLFTIPAGESMDQFSTDFQSTCSTWYPAENGDSYTFLDALVEPGDFQGKNADTEAKLVCAWTDTSGDIILYTTDVAEALGATPLAD
ncbi:hypothetical protein R3P38DRAFT_2836826 [Favolaschia claudopus]|uniref:Uncharacterized protein n=1 Tax=Favolaschia claudopus TaxID=2862362 RepID=A0AAW0E375_9AGAR